MKRSRRSSHNIYHTWLKGRPALVLLVGGLFFAVTLVPTIWACMQWSVLGALFAVSAPLCFAFGTFTTVKGRPEGSVLAVLTFTACIVSSMSLTEYVYITQGDVVQGISVSQTRHYPNGRIFEFSDAVLMCDYTGSYSTTSSSRERPGETTTHAYIVCPLVPEGWTPADPVPAWGKREYSLYKEHPSGTFAAIGPHERSEYASAVKNLLKASDLHTFDDAPILHWVRSLDSYREYLERARTFGDGTVLALFAGWALFAGIFSAKSYKQHRSRAVGKTTSKLPLRTCPHCGARVREDRLQTHITEKCPKKSKAVPQPPPEASQQICSSEEQPRDTTRANVQVLPQGVVITLPDPRSFYGRPFGKRITLDRWKELAKVSAGLLGFLGILGVILSGAVVRPADRLATSSFADLSIGVIIGVAIALIPIVGWIVIGIVAFLNLISRFVGKERILFDRNRMTIRLTFLGISFRKVSYQLEGIRNVQFLPEPPEQQGHVQFEYEGQHITCLRALNASEAKRLFTQISDILTYHCHAVEHIMFGTSAIPMYPSYISLRNPDVSSLTTPFFHLTHLHIHTDSYDFHQLERFLTYAVNYIGEDYLEEHVEVHLHGNPAKLDSNLRNNLINLCKEVHEHPEQ